MRLTHARDLERVRREGKRVLRTSTVDVRALASLLGAARVGIVVPRYRHTAVARNRVKRRLRELVRRELLAALPPADLVIRALPPAYDAAFDRLRRDLLRAAAALGAPGTA